MAIRPIDGDELLGITRLLDTDAVRQSKTASWLLDQVLHDIQAMPTLTPPNELLTLEQLREMEGQWIIIKAFDADISGIMPAFIKDQFATTLCELGSKAIVPDLCEVHFSFNEYGKTWIAYRRPPEGEA